jgi:hypothetical protein
MEKTMRPENFMKIETHASHKGREWTVMSGKGLIIITRSFTDQVEMFETVEAAVEQLDAEMLEWARWYAVSRSE